jgi:uncharacterized small protein (TIGR04563 family)
MSDLPMRGDPRKQSLYFTSEMWEEIRAEAKRLDRPLSYVVQSAWRLARKAIKELPTVEPT